MKRTWVFDKNGKSREITPQRSENKAPYVQPDFEEHGGRSKWREYLKKTGNAEIGHSDLAAATERWNSRKAAHAEQIEKESKHMRFVEPPQGEIVERQRTRLDAEVMNRLDGRPAPDLPMLVKMTLEEARRKR